MNKIFEADQFSFFSSPNLTLNNLSTFFQNFFFFPTMIQCTTCCVLTTLYDSSVFYGPDDSYSSTQCLFSWPHSPGAVPAGQRGRYEPGCLRSQQIQRRKGRADLPDVGLRERSACVMISIALRGLKAPMCNISSDLLA